jgi:glycerol dehydrogenase-like iron-containing ADH family enzyme
MTAASPDDRRGRGLARVLAAAGREPPVLVIADQDVVGRLARVWLESFDEVGWLYRVRSFGGMATEQEIAALAAEARSLGAKSIAAIGDSTLLMAATAAAKTLESITPDSIITFSRSDPCG